MAATSENKRFPLSSFFLSFFPQKSSTRSLVWALLPTFLFFLEMVVAFAQPSVCTPYLFVAALIAAGFTLRFKILGMLSSLPFLMLILLFWMPASGQLWQIGMCASIALTLYILEQVSEEITGSLEDAAFQNRQTAQMISDLQNLQTLAEEKERALQEEIARLKEEAEQRRIDKITADTQLELVQSEIQLLTAQKEEFIQETRLAREAASEAREQMEEWKKEYAAARTTTEKTVQEIAACKAQHQAELSQVQAELKNTIIATQEEILKLQSQPAVAVPVVKEESPSDPKLNGLYNQLRSQFQEKSEVLFRTRSDLFAHQTKLEALEREKTFASLDPDRSEARILERDIAQLIAQIDSLEEEILRLEDVVSSWAQVK